MNPRNTVESLIYKVINNVVSLWGNAMTNEHWP